MEDVIMLPLSDLLFNNTRNISADFAKSRFEKNVNITGFLNVGGAIGFNGPVIIKTLDGEQYDLQTPDNGLPGHILTTDGLGATYWDSGSGGPDVNVLFDGIVMSQAEFNALTVDGLYINQVVGLTGLTGATFGCSFNRTSGVNTVATTFIKLQPCINILNNNITNTWIKNINIIGGWIIYNPTKTTSLDSLTATLFPIGDTNATGILLGKAGVTTSIAGGLVLPLNGVGLSIAGTITGNITPTVTGVNNLGGPALLYNNTYINNVLGLKIDTLNSTSAGTLSIGDTNATGITLGKTGINTTTAGVIELKTTGVGITIAGTITGNIIPSTTDVSNLGGPSSIYNTSYIDTMWTSRIDTGASGGTLTIGDTNATGILLGKDGVTTSTAGIMELTSTGADLILAGTISGDIKPTVSIFNDVGNPSLLYNNVYTEVGKTTKIDTITAGVLSIGTTNAPGITMGKAGITTTTDGILALTSTGVNLSIAGSVSGSILPTVTKINKLGSSALVFKESYTASMRTSNIDTGALGPSGPSGVLTIGETVAVGITLGKAGVMTTTAGTIALTSTGVGMTLAGTITGDIKPTVTEVNDIGTSSLLYGNMFINVIRASRLDVAAGAAGILSIGDTYATEITLGKTGVTTTMAGGLKLTGVGVGMTIAGSITGDILPTITKINKLGSSSLVYAESYINTCKTSKIDTVTSGVVGAAGTLSIGDTNAMGITLGKAGVTTTTAGVVDLTETTVGMTIAGTITGDIIPTVTLVNNLGSSTLLYAESNVNVCKTARIDTITAGTLSIGDTTATGITLGKTGVTTTTAGVLALTGTGVGLSVVGTITGDIIPTVTSVNNLGSLTLLYGESNIELCKTSKIDTNAAGILSIGPTNATEITLGKAGVTTTTAGTIALTSTGVALSVVGTITGDIIPTVTKVNNLGSSTLLYNGSYTSAVVASKLDTVTAGVLSVGDINATGITLGKAGITATTAGTIALTSTGVGMNIAGTITGDIIPTTGSTFKLGTDALPYLSSDIVNQTNTFLKIKNGALTGTLVTSASTSVDLPFILPATQGAAGQILANDGVGNTSWTTVASGGVSIIMCLKNGNGTDQIISNSSTVINFPLIGYTAGNINSATANSIVINADGYYTVNGNIQIQASGLCVVYTEIYKNAIMVSSIQSAYTGPDTDNIGFNEIIKLVIGDIITCRLYTSNTNTATVYQTKSTYILATYIGPLTNVIEITNPSQRWVNSINGSDSTGNGTLSIPWASVGKGFNSAVYPLKINIKGAFTENISLVADNTNTCITTNDGAYGQQSTISGLITTQTGFSSLKLCGVILSNGAGALLTFNDGNGGHSMQNCSFVSTNNSPISTNAAFTNWLHFQDCDFTGLIGAVVLPALTGNATARFINCGLVDVSVGAGWTVYISGTTEFVSTAAIVGQVLKSEVFLYVSVITTQLEFNAIIVHGLYINQVTGLTGLTGASFGCAFSYDGINKLSLKYNELPSAINVRNASLNYDTWLKNKNIAGGWIVYDATKTTELDSISAATLNIGVINATGITLGKSGVTTTTAGTVALTGAGVGLSVMGTITGDIKPTVTLVNNLGSVSLLYNESYINACKAAKFDAVVAGNLNIGDTDATDITLGKTGVTTTTAGVIALTNTGVALSVAGTITGDIKPTVTSVNNLGNALLSYNNLYTTALLGERLERNGEGILAIGDINATAITLGKSGITTTTAGTLALTGTGMVFSMVGTTTGNILPTINGVNNLGSTTLTYNNSFINNSMTPRLDAVIAGPLNIGTNTATSITLGNAGVTTTSAGVLALTSTGVNLNIAGTITGNIIPTVNLVNNLGSASLLYNNVYTDIIQISKFDTGSAGTLLIGDTNATDITIGKTGVIATTAGTLALTTTGVAMTVAGTISGTIKPTVTLANNLGSSSLIYGTTFINSTLSARIDSIVSGNLLIGTSTATGITLGKNGVITTSAGTLALSATGVNLTLVGTVTGSIIPTVTDTNNLGTSALIYSTSYINICRTPRIDAFSGALGAVLIGDTTTLGITLGKTGITTTTAGTVELSSTGVNLTVAGTITGDIKPTVTLVNNLGSPLLFYNSTYITNLFGSRFDTVGADLSEILLVGNTNAIAITIGKAGITTTSAGVIALTGTGLGLSIDGSITGDIKPTVTNVNNLGISSSVYNTAYTGAILALRLDSSAAGTLLIGDTVATAITLGKAGVTTTTAGTLALTGTGVCMTLTGAISSDIKPTITNVNSLGSATLLYNNTYTNTIFAPKCDTNSAGTLLIGDTNATDITLGKAGVTTTVANILTLMGTGVDMALAGTITGDIKSNITSVNSLGSSTLFYNTSYITTNLGARIDTDTAGTLLIGDTTATAITLGKASITTTTAGILAITSTGVGMTLAGTITGNIIPTVTLVNNLGSPTLLYNNAFVSALQTSILDTAVAGTLLIGDTLATAITIGKTGVTITTAGTVALTGTGVGMTLAGTITGDIIPTTSDANRLGSSTLLYNTSYINNMLGFWFDTNTAGTLLIGNTTATAITLGKAGITTTTAGILALTNTGSVMALSGTVTGDIKPTVTNANSLGTSSLLYSNAFVSTIQTAKLDTISPGTLLIGDTNALSITIGKAGVTTTTAGTLALTGTTIAMTIAGTITGTISPTVTSVNDFGTPLLSYSTSYIGINLGSRFDILAAGTLLIGDTTATAITLGKAGVTTTTVGTLALTGTGVNLTLAGTFTGDIKPTTASVSAIGTSTLPYLSSEIKTQASTTFNIRNGATNGTVLTSAASSANIAFVLPTNVGTINQFLRNDGSGNLSWMGISGSTFQVFNVAANGEFIIGDFKFQYVNGGPLFRIKRNVVISGQNLKINGNITTWVNNNSIFIYYYQNTDISTTYMTNTFICQTIAGTPGHLVFVDEYTSLMYELNLVTRTGGGGSISCRFS